MFGILYLVASIIISIICISIHNVEQINSEIQGLKQEIHLLKEINTVLEAIASKVNRFEGQIGIFKSKNIKPFIKNVGVLQISCSVCE